MFCLKSNIAGSSNGRTHASGACYLGSNPGPAVKLSVVRTLETRVNIMKTEHKPTSLELKEIFEADQDDRKNLRNKETNRETIKLKDEARLKRVEELYANGLLEKADDLMNAAMIYQHGDKPEHYKKAFELANKASGLGHPRGKKFSALAEDRYLLKIGKPQIWGTQFIKHSADGAWMIKEPFDRDAKTDEERKEMDLPNIDESLKEMNSRK